MVDSIVHRLKRPCKCGPIQYASLLFAALAVLFTAAPPAHARGERIQNVTVEIENNEIYVSAKLTGGFRKEIVDDIHNGIPKNFYYYLVLKRKEKNWFDEEMLSKTIRYTVKYDTLKKVYTVTETTNGTSIEKQAEDFPSMKALVTQVKGTHLASILPLNRGKRYFVSVQAQMQAAKRPFYLDYFLFFIPFLEIDTPWADSPQIVFPKAE